MKGFRHHVPSGSLLSRKEFLGKAGLLLAGTSLSALPVLGAGTNPSSSRSPYVHRAYNGWITDLASEPDRHAVWPSMRLDERLLADYDETFGLMRRLGFNEIVIWGLYVANNWPVDLASAVPPARGRLVERLIAAAHQRGLKVLSGLGAYSWGFANIIRAHPNLNGGNANAMCASQPESHAWMRRVVDYVFDRFAIDGVSMQPADQGRCPCARCAPIPDAEYHAGLVIRTAEYIRSKWPRMVLGMSNWGLSFGNPRDRETFARLSRSLDYLIDQNNSAQWGGPAYRRQFIAGLGCAFGTTGGPVVEPPQHWPRDRWFLPTCHLVYEHVRALAADGGRACEFFYHILANPSNELTFHVAGRALANPEAPLDRLMADAVDELYRPKDSAARNRLVRFFLEAETAYCQYLARGYCGTISLEPLVSDKPGPPVYVRERLDSKQRVAYARALVELENDWARLRLNLRARTRADRLTACLKNAQADLR